MPKTKKLRPKAGSPKTARASAAKLSPEQGRRVYPRLDSTRLAQLDYLIQQLGGDSTSMISQCISEKYRQLKQMESADARPR